MYFFWFCLVLAQCGFIFLLARCGTGLERKAVRERQANCHEPQGGWPAVAMIIPVAGNDARILPALQSLVQQDYPHVQPVLVTASADEPAAAAVRELQKCHPQVRHVVAGTAQACGQKNHNSLQGVAAVGESADIYVFCDSSHKAESDFVRNLVAPLARGEAAFSTGYHCVTPADSQTVTLAYTCSVLLMRFLQGLSAFTQLWGGAMAMRRTAFVEHKVAELWAGNVVDDCSLSAYLQQKGVHVALCAAALLRTECAAHSRSVWQAWMDRQILFLKFCMPAQWVLLGVFALLMLLPVLLGGVAVAGFFKGGGIFMLMLWLGGLFVALDQWRQFVSLSVPPLRWLWAFICAILMFGRVYAAGMTASGVLWHGIWYEVGRGGTVKNMQRNAQG